MQHESTGIRVVEANRLGWEAALVRIGDETVLLVDDALDSDQLMGVMTRAMRQVSD